MGKRKPWNQPGDSGRAVYLTKRRRRGTLTVVAPVEPGSKMTVGLALNLDAKALRRLGARCVRVADVLDQADERARRPRP